MLLAACGPDLNSVANRLREQTMQQDREIADLKDKLARSDAAVKDLQSKLESRYPPLQTLPQSRLNELYTAAKLDLRKQTDSWAISPSATPNGFRVFFRTLAEDGTNIPATGNVLIEAFELPPAPAEPKRIGTWTFSPADLKKNWYAGFGLNQFAVNCPWQAPPTAPDISFRMHFTDALTGRTLEARLDKKITLQPAPPS